MKIVYIKSAVAMKLFGAQFAPLIQNLRRETNVDSEFLIDIGFAVLLRLVKNQRRRKQFASALAKLYVAILRESEHDSVLQKAIKDKLEE